MYQKSRVVEIPHELGVNGTGVDLSNPVSSNYMHGQSVGFGFLGVAALCAAFATITVHIRDKGLSSDASCTSIGEEEFTTSNTDLVTNPTITMWNSVFLALVVSGHALVAVIVCSPSSTHAIVLFTLAIYVSMSGILQPR
jgi:hypothetical protein